MVFPVLLFDSRPLPAPKTPGNTSKPKGRPRKYQDGATSCAGTRSCGEMGIPVGPLWQGGWGFIGAWFAAGMWTYRKATRRLAFATAARIAPSARL